MGIQPVERLEGRLRVGAGEGHAEVDNFLRHRATSRALFGRCNRKSFRPLLPVA